jgi:isoleucyl-tRNA synthetase
MSKFTEYKNLSLTETAKNIAEFWKNNDTFKKSVELREGQPEFVFYEGPPSANGMPGIHHVMARAIKDIFAVTRRKTGNRFSVKPVGTHTDFL